MVKPGDTISINNKYSLIEKIIKTESSVGWIDLDNMCGIFKYIPERKQIPENINEQLIVQWYSK
jgi:small subunit ribosomal protein S4